MRLQLKRATLNSFQAVYARSINGNRRPAHIGHIANQQLADPWPCWRRVANNNNKQQTAATTTATTTRPVSSAKI